MVRRNNYQAGLIFVVKQCSLFRDKVCSLDGVFEFEEKKKTPTKTFILDIEWRRVFSLL